MSTASVLTIRPGPYTLSDLEAMPEDGQQYELIDGSLHVTPAPTPLHQLASARLCALFAAQAPGGLDAVFGVDLACGPGNVLQPDAAIVPTKAIFEGGRVIPAEDVLLVAEIVSPSSARMDRVLKPTMYAEAGIPDYLLVELDVPRLTWFHLSSTGFYAVRDEAAGDEPLVIAGRLGLEIVPRALVAPRG
jgi:Uma2 family endonuclease